jgi:hypothetical protein
MSPLAYYIVSFALMILIAVGMAFIYQRIHRASRREELTNGFAECE